LGWGEKGGGGGRFFFSGAGFKKRGGGGWCFLFFFFWGGEINPEGVAGYQFRTTITLLPLSPPSYPKLQQPVGEKESSRREKGDKGIRSSARTPLCSAPSTRLGFSTLYKIRQRKKKLKRKKGRGTAPVPSSTSFRLRGGKRVNRKRKKEEKMGIILGTLAFSSQNTFYELTRDENRGGKEKITGGVKERRKKKQRYPDITQPLLPPFSKLCLRSTEEEKGGEKKRLRKGWGKEGERAAHHHPVRALLSFFYPFRPLSRHPRLTRVTRGGVGKKPGKRKRGRGRKEERTNTPPTSTD